MNQLANKYGTYEKQKKLLAMMKDIDLILRTKGVKYSLCGGSLLGAVREKGFIPWDDDIDIMVDRKNYRRLIEALAGIKEYTPYQVNRYLWIDRIQYKDDKRHPLYADTIDIFVMDNCPDNDLLRKIKLFLIMTLQGMMKKDRDYKNASLAMKLCLIITYVMGKAFSDKRKFKWYQKIAQYGNNRKTRFMTGYTDLFKCLSLRYPGSLFDKINDCSFEDAKFMITAEYDSYLSTQYGDYMTPPDEKDRLSIHMN